MTSTKSRKISGPKFLGLMFLFLLGLSMLWSFSFSGISGGRSTLSSTWQEDVEQTCPEFTAQGYSTPGGTLFVINDSVPILSSWSEKLSRSYYFWPKRRELNGKKWCLELRLVASSNDDRFHTNWIEAGHVVAKLNPKKRMLGRDVWVQFCVAYKTDYEEFCRVDPGPGLLGF
jgi:hypothetical protein